jgi:hypothetical protein
MPELVRVQQLARWASALLAVGGVISVVLSLMPDDFYRLLAVPTGIAMIGLGYSLWRTTRTSTTTQPAAVNIPAPRQESPSGESTISTSAALQEQSSQR